MLRALLLVSVGWLCASGGTASAQQLADKAVWATTDASNPASVFAFLNTSPSRVMCFQPGMECSSF